MRLYFTYAELKGELSSGKGWIGKIHVGRIQLFRSFVQRLTESLEMHNFPLPEKADHIVHIRIVGKPEDADTFKNAVDDGIEVVTKLVF